MLVIKAIGGQFTVFDKGQIFVASARGNLKQEGIIVGDNVKLENLDGTNIITQVFPRKNQLVRPPLANIDSLLIVIAPSPRADLLLVDKILIECKIKNITPYLIINKIDIAEKDFILNIQKVYRGLVEDIIEVSAETLENIDKIKAVLGSKINAITGQSAAGKSSILNALSNHKLNLKTDDVIRKMERGKNTTRHSEIYVLENKYFIADTPGFTSLDLDETIKDIEKKDIAKNMEDINKLSVNCKYPGCTHTNESKEDCGVIKAVELGKLPLSRHLNYIKIYKSIKKKWEKKNDKK